MKMREDGVVTLVGDHRQLPPTISNVEVDVEGLGTSLFERLSSHGVEPFMLNIQYRMHPAIASYPSVASYGGQLRSGVSGQRRRAPQGIAWPIPEAPVVFLPVEGEKLPIGKRNRSTVFFSTFFFFLNSFFSPFFLMPSTPVHLP